MDKQTILTTAYLKEMEAEAKATRKCLENMNMELSDYKPHEKSMTMGYLALLVAEIPKWVSYMIEKGDIDFATFEHFQPKTTEELVKHFDENMDTARKALTSISDQDLDKDFSLKRNGQILFSTKLKDIIGSTINHGVHHRGQFTVYLRLNNLPVPAIYGPSADEKTF